MHGGERADYNFPDPYSSITWITPVDLAEQAGVRLRLYSISVTDNRGRVVAFFGPTDLDTFARYFLTAPVPDPSSLDMTTTAPGSNVGTFRDVSDTANLPAPLGTLVNAARSSQDRLALALWSGAIAVFVALLFSRRTWKWIVGGVAVAAASASALYEAALHPGALESPVDAVGTAAFDGLSVATNTHAVYAMYALAAFVAVLFIIVDRRVVPVTRGQGHGERTAAGQVSATPEPSRSTPHRGWIVVAFSLILVVAAFLPDLRSVITSTRSDQYSPGWDSDSLLAWTSFAVRGLVPMKDFWYPYDNDLLFQSGLLSGPMFYCLYQAIGVGSYAWVFWRLSGRRHPVLPRRAWTSYSNSPDR